MTYYGGEELARSFRTVRANTVQTAKDIAEQSYGFAPATGGRSVSEILAHIAVFPQLQHGIHGPDRRASFEGFDFLAVMERMAEQEAVQRTKAEIIDLLEQEGDVWATFLDGLPEAFLAESFAMPPGATPAAKSRFEMLLSVKEHEMHHRGQLMYLQRLLGLVPHLTRAREEQMAAMSSSRT